MKYHRNKSYVNYGAIPSNEFSQNMDDRQVAYDIEAEKSLALVDEETQLHKRSMWLHGRSPRSGSKNNAKEVGWRANSSSMDMLSQFEYIDLAASSGDLASAE